LGAWLIRCRNYIIESARPAEQAVWRILNPTRFGAEDMFNVYVLRSIKDEQLHVGYTRDLKKRYKEHNEGKTVSTRVRRPFLLIFYEAYINENDAKRREQYLKTTKGKSTLRMMLQNYFSQNPA
jgi:putative endonuclease